MLKVCLQEMISGKIEKGASNGYQIVRRQLALHRYQTKTRGDFFPFWKHD